MDLGIDPENLRLTNAEDKLAHYSTRTVDIEYRFDFQGTSGVSSKASRTAPTTTCPPLEAFRHGPVFFDQATGERFMPTSSSPRRD